MHSSLYKISWSVKNSLNARPFKDKNSFFTVQIIFEAWNKEYERNPVKCIEYLRWKCYQNQKLKTMYNNFDFMWRIRQSKHLLYSSSKKKQISADKGKQ